MDLQITYPAAVLAGALSFVSPCVLPLVPPYLCYMAGVTADDLRSRPDLALRLRILSFALVFVLGFATVFVALGAGASSVGQVLRRNLDWIGIVAGLGIVAMGLNFLGVLRIAAFSGEMRFRSPDRPRSLIGAYLMGLAFAFGWTPCIGPVLGAILGIAGTRSTAGEGATMLAFYSFGLGIPFVVAAMFSGAFMGWSARFRRHFRTIEKVVGVLLVATGILFVTGGMQSVSFWLLETFPVLQTIG